MERHARVYPAAALALLLPVLYTFGLIAPFWSGRYLVLVILAAAGVPLLITNAARLDAKAALAFAAFATISTALSETPLLAFFGDFGLGTGLLFIFSIVGAWALGGIAGGSGRRLIVMAIAIAALANGALAALELIVDLSEVGLGAFPGRASGFLGNPVFLGAFLSASAWMIALDAMNKVRAWLVAILLLCGVGVQLSGSRIALLLLIVPCAITFIRRRRLGFLVTAALTIGLAVGSVIAAQSAASAGSDRLADSFGSSGAQARLEVWAGAAQSIADRPLFGSGPGRFGVATSPFRTLALVRAEGPEVYFFDAHNLVVEYAVTAGVLGAIALGFWIITSLWRARPFRDPLAGFAVALLATHLLQPQNVALTPLLFLALGAAVGPMALPRRAAASSLALGCMALVPIALLGFGLFALDQARLDFEQARAEQADRLLPPWRQATEQLARVFVLRAIDEQRPRLRGDALAARSRVVAENPGDPRGLKTLAIYQAELGQRDASLATMRRLLTVDPWSPTALNALGFFHAQNGAATGRDAERALTLLRRSLAVVPEQEGAQRLVARLEGNLGLR